ncbi:MAG TPA: hypothetical protein VIF57_24585, partial [Polyangia bacterium]
MTGPRSLRIAAALMITAGCAAGSSDGGSPGSAGSQGPGAGGATAGTSGPGVGGSSGAAGVGGASTAGTGGSATGSGGSTAGSGTGAGGNSSGAGGGAGAAGNTGTGGGAGSAGNTGAGGGAGSGAGTAGRGGTTGSAGTTGTGGTGTGGSAGTTARGGTTGSAGATGTGGTTGTAGTTGTGGAPPPAMAFPGAQGFGKKATGARNGVVYHVTNLNDTGAGSFRDAVGSSNRFVVFDVGGYVSLVTAVSVKSNITIAGQSAPGGGIGFRGGEISFANQSNIIMRHVRIRPGSDTASTEDDALSLYKAHNVMIDHSSFEFAPWNNIDAVSDDWQNAPMTDVTIQDSLIADPTGQQFGAHTESVSSQMA